MKGNIDLYRRLCRVIELEFPRVKSPITPETKASEVTGWDSLGHNRLIIAIEDEFKIKLPIAETLYITSVQALGELVIATCEKND